MKKIILIFFLLTIAVFSYSQTSHSLGIAGGFLSAGGFSYRQVSELYGYQINLIAVGSKEVFPVILGGKFLYQFHKTYKSRIYYFAGGAFIHDIGKEKTINNLINIGGGIGFEFTIHSNLRFSFDMPVTFSDIVGNNDDDYFNVISLIPDLGFHYYF